MSKISLSQQTLLALKKKRERDKLMEALESTQPVPELDESLANEESISHSTGETLINDPPPTQQAPAPKTQSEMSRKTLITFMTSKLVTRLLTIGVIVSLLLLASLGVVFGYYYLNHHAQAPASVKVESSKHKSANSKEKNSQSSDKAGTSDDKGVTQSSTATQPPVQQQSQQEITQQNQSKTPTASLPSVGAQGVASNQQASQSQTQPKVVTQQPAQPARSTQANQDNQAAQSSQLTQQSTNAQATNTQKEQTTSSSTHKSSINSNPVYDAWDDEDELVIYDSKGNPVNVIH